MKRAGHRIGSYLLHGIRPHLGRVLTTMGLVTFYTSATCVLRPPAIAAAAAEHMQVLYKIDTITVLEMVPRPSGETCIVGASIDCHNCIVPCSS